LPDCEDKTPRSLTKLTASRTTTDADSAASVARLTQWLTQCTYNANGCVVLITACAPLYTPAMLAAHNMSDLLDIPSVAAIAIERLVLQQQCPFLWFPQPHRNPQKPRMESDPHPHIECTHFLARHLLNHSIGSTSDPEFYFDLVFITQFFNCC
jgi:hypothetical protein